MHLIIRTSFHSFHSLSFSLELLSQFIAFNSSYTQNTSTPIYASYTDFEFLLSEVLHSFSVHAFFSFLDSPIQLLIDTIINTYTSSYHNTSSELMFYRKMINYTQVRKSVVDIPYENYTLLHIILYATVYLDDKMLLYIYRIAINLTC